MPLWGLKWKNGFSHVCALSWASPGHFFSFFSSIMWWMKYRCIDFEQEIGNNFIFFIIFLPFLPLFPILGIFAHLGHFCVLMGNPSTPPQLLTIEMLSLGFSSMISMIRKLLKVHHKPLSSVTTCHVVVKTDYVTFSMFVHSHGPPHDTFSFFLAWCGGWSIVALISDKKLGSFSLFFIIFCPFLPIFPIFGFLPHFAHFRCPHGWPLITLDPNSYI